MINFSNDNFIEKSFLKAEDIIRNLSNEQVKNIVYSLGADRHEETDKGYIFPTICHNYNIEEARPYCLYANLTKEQAEAKLKELSKE